MQSAWTGTFDRLDDYLATCGDRRVTIAGGMRQ